MVYFFDTYTLIEIIRGNPNYKDYINEEFIITKLHLMELYYSLLRLFDEKTAIYYFNLFKPACIEFNDDTIMNAMKFRLLQRKKRNLISYVNCIGYIIALENNIRILTGEKHFLGLKNVEYVK